MIRKRRLESIVLLCMVLVPLLSPCSAAQPDPDDSSVESPEDAPGAPDIDSPIDPARLGYSGRTKEEYEEVVTLLEQYRDHYVNHYKDDPKMRDVPARVSGDDGDVSALGDILLTPSQAQSLVDSIDKRQYPESMSPFPIRYWPNTDFYYTLDRQSYSHGEFSTVLNAFKWWQSVTCLRFGYVSAEDILYLDQPVLYVRRRSDEKCTSFVGYANLKGNFPQFINIGSECLDLIGDVVHMIGHALGLHHEHQRYDAGYDVRVSHENARSIEAIIASLDITPYRKFNLPFDRDSIMLYPFNAFAVEKKATLITHSNQSRDFFGQRSRIGFTDAQAINMAYCSDKCKNTLKCQNGGYQDPNECAKCVCPEIYEGTLCEQLISSNVGLCYPRRSVLPVLTNASTVCIRTPRFGRLSYYPRENCTWFIQVPKGCITQLWIAPNRKQKPHILRLSDDEDEERCGDWLEIRFQTLSSSMRLCGEGRGGFPYHEKFPYYFGADQVVPVLFRSFVRFPFSPRTYRQLGAEICYKLKNPSCIRRRCTRHTCRNGGTCEEILVKGSYKCLCTDNYTGKHCERSANTCASNPCENGGTCRNVEDTYECTCTAGFTGENCWWEQSAHIDPARWKYSGRTKEEYEEVVSLLDQYRAKYREMYEDLAKKNNIPQRVAEDEGDPSALGDVLFTPAQARALLDSIGGRQPHTPLPITLWPKSEIVYTMKYQSFKSYEFWILYKAFRWWFEKTCVAFHIKWPWRLHELQNQTVLVIRYSPNGRCSSFLGYTHTQDHFAQFLNVGSDCLHSVGAAAHILGHTLGLYHEHQRYDASEHVRIRQENVRSIEALIANFGQTTYQKFDEPYDPSSIMHFPVNAYAKGNLQTLIPPNPYLTSIMGQRSQLSFTDVHGINKAYCSDKCYNTFKCENGGYQSPKKCYQCVCPDIYEGVSCDHLNSPSTSWCEPESGPLPVLTNDGTVCIRIPTPRFINGGGLHRYIPEEHCTWFIQVPAGCTAQIWINTTNFKQANILKLSNNKRGKVCADWLEIRPARSDRYGIRLCGNTKDGSFMFPPESQYYLSVDSVIPVIFRAFRRHNAYRRHKHNKYSGLRGEFCYKLADPTCVTGICQSRPCQHGGTCRANTAGSGYRCECATRYTGENCEQSNNFCASYPCKNDALCSAIGPNEYECHCRAGYTGHHCESRLPADTLSDDHDTSQLVSGELVKDDGYQALEGVKIADPSETLVALLITIIVCMIIVIVAGIGFMTYRDKRHPKQPPRNRASTAYLKAQQSDQSLPPS